MFRKEKGIRKASTVKELLQKHHKVRRIVLCWMTDATALRRCETHSRPQKPVIYMPKLSSNAMPVS